MSLADAGARAPYGLIGNDLGDVPQQNVVTERPKVAIVLICCVRLRVYGDLWLV